MLTFKFTGADGIMTVQELLTSGMVGKQVRFEFTSDWDDLQKTAVFVAGDVSRAVVNVGTEAVIPAEVLQAPNQRLFVGIFGVNAEGTLIIPTVMAKGPKIHKGAEPSDDPSTDPDPEVWQQMLSAIGDLNKLTTEAKSSLVAAINELAKGSNPVKVDTTLTMEGAAADAKTTGDKMPTFADVDDTGLVSFKNLAGVTLFTLDLAGFGGDVYFGNVITSAESIAVTEGGTNTFTVCLETAPSGNQAVYLAVSDNSRLSVSPATLIFTPDNYSVEQIVTVTALQDDDENDDSLVVTLTSRKVDARQLIVTIADDDKPVLVADGLILHFDYTNKVDDTSDVWIDSASGVSVSGFSSVGKNDNGIYGNGTAVWLTPDRTTEEYETFKEKFAESASNGFTVEAFGNFYARMFYFSKVATGNTAMLHNGTYAITSSNASASYLSSAAPYVNSNGESVVTTAKASKLFSAAENYTEYFHTVIVFEADGAINIYANGTDLVTNSAAPEDFAGWDIDTIVDNLYLAYTASNRLPTDETNFLSAQRIYNRPLTLAEINKNLEADKAKLGLITF